MWEVLFEIAAAYSIAEEMAEKKIPAVLSNFVLPGDVKGVFKNSMNMRKCAH